MTPYESRMCAQIVQKLSPKDRADFYVALVVDDKDPVDYLYNLRKKQVNSKSMFDANQAVHDFYLVMSNAQEKSESPYTNNALRERIKARVMAGSEGGRPGQWSARKAQLVATRYRKAGGGYKKGKRPNKKQRSLRKWTREKWRTSDGKPALRGGKMRRYLPDKVWGRLSPAQRAATNRKKIQGDKRGQQFVANTDTAKDKARNYRQRNKF